MGSVLTVFTAGFISGLLPNRLGPRYVFLTSLVAAALLVTLTSQLFHAFLYGIFLATGASLPLLMASGVVVGEAAAWQSKRRMPERFPSALAATASLALALGAVAILRELSEFALGESAGFHLASTPTGALLMLAGLLAALNGLIGSGAGRPATS